MMHDDRVDERLADMAERLVIGRLLFQSLQLQMQRLCGQLCSDQSKMEPASVWFPVLPRPSFLEVRADSEAHLEPLQQRIGRFLLTALDELLGKVELLQARSRRRHDAYPP